MKIIAIEGIDGAGKTFASNVIYEILAKQFNTVLLDFPRYNTQFGEQIGKYLSGNLTRPDKWSFALWYALDRFEALKALPECDFLVCNRFTFSSMAFMGIEYWNFIEQLENKTLGIPVPDKYYILDVDIYAAHKRNMQKKDRGYINGLDHNEVDLTKQDAARNNYLLLSREPQYSGKVKIINASASQGEVSLSIVQDLISNETRGS